jgi:hypothetical protein
LYHVLKQILSYPHIPSYPHLSLLLAAFLKGKGMWG